MSQDQDANSAPPFALDEDEAKPVKITCKSTDCAKDLHCYSEDERKKTKEKGTGLPVVPAKPAVPTS